MVKMKERVKTKAERKSWLEVSQLENAQNIPELFLKIELITSSVVQWAQLSPV